MSDSQPLSDDAVYALLQDCRNLLSDRTVATTNGQAVISIVLRQIDMMQTAMVVLRDQATETPL